MYVQSDPGSNLPWPGQKPENQGESTNEKQAARQKIKPVGRVQQHETKASPAIAETAEVGRTATLVGPEDDGNLGDAGADLAGLDDKLEGKFHSRAAQVQPVVESAAESAHAAIAIAHSRAEKEIHQPTEAGISEISVQRRHGAGLDPAAKAIAHDEVIAAAEFIDKIRDLAEIVAVVGVAHDDVFTARSGDARF